MSKTALVLGATGGIGGEVARSLLRRGWQVRGLHRGASPPAGERDMRWVQGDAMDAAAVTRASRDVSLIVHAVNPPGYRNWAQLVLPMLESTLAAAGESGARILLPGTVYNYGPDAFPRIAETSAQNPVTRKGAIRVAMERRLQEAAHRGIRSLVVRAGDFFGGRARNNWFSQGLVAPGKPVKSVSYPGTAGIGHQWCYLPDVAETMLRLVEREDALEDFATFHMEGFWDADGRQMVSAIARVLGDPELRVRRFPWGLLRIASPFVQTLRELTEMRYLWREPVRMTNERLRAFLGEEPQTDIDTAVRATLAGLGCIPQAPGVAADLHDVPM